MGPISCLLIHSYHILIGFIHTPHHATSMLVFYALIIVTFILTLKASYYNFFKLYTLWCSKKYSLELSKWKTVASCCNRISRDLCCCVFEKNETVDQSTDENNGSQPGAVEDDVIVHICAVALISCLSIFTGLVFVYIAFLFILVPINSVIDDAPARILSINQTIVILFGAAITYKIYQDRKFETFLDYLVRAATKMVTGDQIKDGHFKDIKENTWKKMSRNERRKEVAYVALSAMYKTADIK